ncbi:MAG: DUF2399 domain-containing protein [Oscillospiraceae bacterium]|nr:DUF2399 domain-containing protein [Oscillospiraceae bacterium]
MNYEKDILDKLIDVYERRGYFKKQTSEMKSVSLNISKEYSEYFDKYDHSTYEKINISIDNLIRKTFVSSKKNTVGEYEKIKLELSSVPEIYLYLRRKPLADKATDLINVLSEFENSEHNLICNVVSDFYKKVKDGKKILYSIEYSEIRLRRVLEVLTAILNLKSETYIRNFSDAVFKDSKTFVKEYRSSIQSILFDYSDTSVEKERILEVYNLYDNPTYVMLKGNAVVSYHETHIALSEISGGIALPESALDDIRNIEVLSDSVITVENLTTYHDCSDKEGFYIYLGGFHNHSKQILLKKIYDSNPELNYFHKGDIDVFGFAILESLIERTGIPFIPMEMDLETLGRYYQAGLYKPLTNEDKKAMESPRLSKYAEIFEFMKQNNCKVEQESIKAIEIMDII